MRWCKSCGAAVEGDPSRTVHCPQCGTDNPPLPAQATSPIVRIAAVGAMAVVGIGFAALFFFQVEPPPDAAQAPPRGARSARPAPRGPLLQVFRDDLCFVDAGGDDAPDPVVWMSDGMTASRAAAIDGRTGQARWATPQVKARLPLACAAPDTVIAGADESGVRALDARTGAERWRADLPSAPEDIVVGEGCITVISRGGIATGISLASGAPAPCPSAPAPEPFSGPRWARTKNPRAAQAGDVELRLSAAVEAESKLTLEGLRGGASAWTRPLDARAPGIKPELMIAVAGNIAVVAGTDPAGGGRMRFIGVDAASGQLLYTRPAGWAGPNIPAMAASGTLVVVIAGGSLRAIDAATGEETWQAVAPAKLP